MIINKKNYLNSLLRRDTKICSRNVSSNLNCNAQEMKTQNKKILKLRNHQNFMGIKIHTF